MPPIGASARDRATPGLCLGALLTLGGLVFCGSAARADPPLRGPEDAACRLEARARVFSTPNPRGLEPEVLGKQIYYACMRRLEGPPKRHRRHRRQ